MTIPEDIKKLFEKKYITEPNSGCWIWLGGLAPNGYGRWTLGKKSIAAHRLSYILAGGIIPFGFTLDHLCRVRACVNPRHLEPVTSRVNILRGIGRTAINARKTHCLRGHPFTPENTAYQKTSRMCRKCYRIKKRQRYWKHHPEIGRQS